MIPAILFAAAIALPNGTPVKIVPDGKSETVRTELRDAVTLKPDSAYALSYSIRSDKPIHAVVGTGFAELGGDEPGGNEWRRRTAIFVTPSRGGAFPATLHFGQWLPNGTSEIRDVDVAPLSVRHSAFGGIELGGGERLDGNEYLYSFPFGRDCRNVARPLHRFECRMHGRLWWFGHNSSVTYRHGLAGRRFLGARVFAGSSDWSGGDGAVTVEVSSDAQNWIKVGEVRSRSCVDADLPGSLFPCDEVFVRLSGGEGCTVQVAHYNLKGMVDGKPARLFGSTELCGEDGTVLAKVGPSAFDEGTYGMLVAKDRGIRLWTASSGRKVTRTRLPPKSRGGVMSVCAAANEAESVQLVVNADSPLADVKVMFRDDFTCPRTGERLPAAAFDVKRVDYEKVRHPTDFAGLPIDVPDRLVPMDGRPTAVGRNENQPFWLTVKPPKGTRKGQYRGTVDVALTHLGGKVERISVPMSVEVFGFELPDRMSCETAFGLTASLVAKAHRIANGTPEHRDVMERYLAAMSECHLSPYYPAPFDGWKVTWNGDVPAFDFSAWDREMERVLGKFHFNAFQVWLPGLGECNISSRKDPEFMGLRPSDVRYEKRLGAYLSAIDAHLREKGWQDMAYAYVYDEPRAEDHGLVRDGFGFLAKHAPGIRRMLPALTHSAFDELDGAVNLWCPQLHAISFPGLSAARARGDRLWWYLCNNPKAPYVCNFVDHPAPELRIWLWQTWKEGVGGVLIWDVFNWRGQTDHPDQNGEGRLLYPPDACWRGDAPVMDAPVLSVRAVHLRDGIEDYEYLSILRRLDPSNPLLRVPHDVTTSLTEFSLSSDAIETHRIRVAREIEKIAVRTSK